MTRIGRIPLLIMLIGGTDVAFAGIGLGSFIVDPEPLSPRVFLNIGPAEEPVEGEPSNVATTWKVAINVALLDGNAQQVQLTIPGPPLSTRNPLGPCDLSALRRSCRWLQVVLLPPQ